MAGGGATTPASLLCAVPRGRERCAGATAPSAAAETWWQQGTAPGRWGDGGAKGQRRREQARLAPRGEWARGFGAGAGDLTQEVGELPREGGFGAGSWGRARERGDCEPAPLGEESEGEGRDSNDDSERRGIKSLLEDVFPPFL